MALFVNGPEQGLTVKMDVFQHILVFLLAIATEHKI